MKIRPEVFDTYWKFAALRQEVFFGRLGGLPYPWTSDEIINTYKFCNTYRASDRVSQYLIRNVIYDGRQNEEEVVFRILLFKIFNKIETWEYLKDRIGEIRLAGFRFDEYSRILQEAMDADQAIYTSAYMSCASKAYGYDKKHQNHLALIYQMNVEDNIASKIVKTRRMEEVFNLLVSYPLIGNFMAYQLTIDINYSEVIDFSENDFTVPGPGAERGIKKCFTDTQGKSNTYVINWMRENQEREFERLGIGFKDLWGRSLTAIDCQGLFCETDKYSRAAFPELKSNRKRIKSKFQPNHVPIAYFYPPKWKINQLVEADVARQQKPIQRRSEGTIQLPLTF